MTLRTDGTLFFGTRGDKVDALPNRKRADKAATLVSGINARNGGRRTELQPTCPDRW